MKAITRLFKANVSAPDKSTKNSKPKSGTTGGANKAGGYASQDSLGNNTGSAHSKSQTNDKENAGFSEGLKPVKEKPKSRAMKAVDQNFSKTYGAMGELKPRSAQVRFKETSEADTRLFTRSDEEIKWSKDLGDLDAGVRVGKLLDLAKAKQMPVIDKDARMMAWPSKHTFEGVFDKKNLPMRGKLTLPTGEELDSHWQDGRCYRATNEEKHVVNVDLAPVTKVHVR